MNGPNDCPYRNVRHAIHCAYASEVAEVWGRNLDLYDLGKDDDDPADDNLRLSDFVVSEYLGALTHDPAGDYRDDLSAYEWIAEGAWTLALIRDTLPPDLAQVLDARFTVPTKAKQHSHKVTSVQVVCNQVVKAATYAKPDRRYCLATVADWAGLGELNDDAAMDRYGVNWRTLHRWRHGRQPWGDGIVCTLNDWLQEAENILHAVLTRRGLVVSDSAAKCENGIREKRKGSAHWSGLIHLRMRKSANESGSAETAGDVPAHSHAGEAGFRRAG